MAVMVISSPASCTPEWKKCGTAARSFAGHRIAGAMRQTRAVGSD
ncbi:hypothetical protein [Serratia inhibens]|nr:hypothetical protein [Serratia inhibens]